MSSAAGGPERPLGAPQSLPGETVGRAGQSIDPALLERVLRETAELWQEEPPSVNGDFNALQEVARQHRGESLVTGPIAGELVYAVVRPRFQGPGDSSVFWQNVSVHVAETLLGDPVAHDRLQALWVRLAESVS